MVEGGSSGDERRPASPRLRWLGTVLVIVGWAGFAAAVGLSVWAVDVLDDSPFPLPTRTSKVVVIAVVAGTVSLVSVAVLWAGASLRARSNEP